MIAKNKAFELLLFLVLAVSTYLVVQLLLSNDSPSGDPSIEINNSSAFLQPLKNLDRKQTREFILGKNLFHGTSNDNRAPEDKNIGPLFNALTCGECHLRGGTGDPKRSPSISIKIESKDGRPDSIYGEQIQLKSIPPITPEATIVIDKESKQKIYKLNQGRLDNESVLSERIAPKIIGMGLIEAIPDSFFFSVEDEFDRNRDGISGRISFTKNSSNNKSKISRFNTDASVADIKYQTLHAAFLELGLTNSYFGVNNCNEIVNCTGTPELTFNQERFLTFYTRAIAPPRRRDLDNESKMGRRIFNSIGCSSCHIGSIKLQKSDLVSVDNVYVHPLSDFLLHDLSNNSESKNSPKQEFRTTPLWGIGLSKKVNGSLSLMHDGSAKSIPEAIDKHFGEGSSSREKYFKLSTKDKLAIEKYLMTL